ncbi:hypothetical protein [Flavobacterium sp.]|uniref:hypothetical protein n=1 Tax=Flavobacterium sp. TaxID=239 RepID=UPI003919DB76
MKPIYKILIFLFSIGALAQPKPVSYTRLILTENPLKVSATRALVQDSATGEFGYISKTDFVEIVEANDFASFPVTGLAGHIYVDKTSNLTYRWNGSAYVLLSPFNLEPLEVNTTDRTVWNNGKANIASNTSFGDEALRSITTGSSNTAYGFSALRSNTSAVANTAIGLGSLNQNTTGSRNVSIGTQTLSNNISATENVAVGNNALLLNTADSNTALGHGALATNTTGTNNVGIGHSARGLNNNDTNQIVIGHNAIGAGSNTATLGNTSITTTRLRGAVQGGSFVKDGGTNLQYLMADGSVSTAPAPKQNILVLIGGQSNSGTDPATGRVPYADMPTYLQGTPTNIKFVNVVMSAYALQDWSPDPANQWGYLNQILYNLSNEYTNVIFSKRAIGGTDILPGHLGNYNRDDFKAKSLYAISQADSQWGAGNYDVVVLWNLGETNGATLVGAQVFEDASKEWFLELRSQVVNLPIIYNKIGTLQRQSFPYIVSNIQPSQYNLSLFDFRNKLVTGESDSKWELQDITGDTSHYNKSGAITLGNNFTEKIFEVLEREKTNNIPPVLVSVTCTNASPNQVILTYDKTLNPAVSPFWKDFVLSGTRKVISTSISGSTCILNLSEPFYNSGSTITLTYYRCDNTESSIQDLFGNKAIGFTSVPIVSTVTTGTPTYTNRYTSNFSAGVDGWTGDANTTPSAPETIDGVSNALKVLLNGDTTPLVYKTGVLTGTIGHTYRVKFSIYVPEAYFGNGVSVSSINLKTSAETFSFLYPQLRGYLMANKWLNLEFTFTTATTGTQLRFEGVGVLGSSFYLKNIVVDKIN